MSVKNFGYDFKRPEILGYNGISAPILSSLGSTLTLTYPELTPTDWVWWTTLLSNAEYAEFTQAQLYDDDENLTSFAHCIVYKPVRGNFLLGKHANVTVRITDIY